MKKKDNYSAESGYWEGFVLVSKDMPSVRFSPVFDSLKEANAKKKEWPTGGVKVISVRIFPV